MRYPHPIMRCGSAWGALLLAVALLAGCGGSDTAAQNSAMPSPAGGSSIPSAVAQAQVANTPVDAGIVAADSVLALNLFNTLNQGAAGNVAISPTSIALALQIAYNGAAGSTQQAMAQTLQLQNLSLADLNAANAALQASLINPDPQVQLTLANSLWMHLAGNTVLPAFIQVNQSYYGAQIGDLAGAPANVNAWVSNETNGLITDILPGGINYSEVAAVIVNAIYFKGAWSSPFDSSQTAAAPFMRQDGTQTSCQMMHQNGSFPYLQGANFQALRLPYGQSGHLSMFIVLPSSGTDFGTFVAGITADALNTWESGLRTEFGSVALPRFTSSYGASLVPALTSLGMGIAFMRGQADFSALAPNTYIEDVEHKTVVEVDESGTVATGATSVVVGINAVEAPTFSMTMDHPFFYAIRDDQTGVLLFIGTLMNPN
jgi:serine protease inhibitor